MEQRRLSPQELINIPKNAAVQLPTSEELLFPEKVLQFGTGVLLRGLPDYFIDKANKQGLFKGRIVVVKSTDTGGTDAFAMQDGLYTQCIRGLENGNRVEDYVVNASISRVLSAKTQWDTILEFAKSPELRLIVSNTTELGIVSSEDRITDAPPATFPGKLLAVLYQRYQALGESEAPGLVIVPTELVVDNAKKLKSILLELIQKNHLAPAFTEWLETKNYFCSSLVDRIVPGKLEQTDEQQTSAVLGYSDDLKFMSEVFRLWAIESDSEKVREVLSFAAADAGVVIAPDIEQFRELKLRLLNGTHTFACGLALLAGFENVKEALTDAPFEAFVQQLTKNEIAPVLERQGIDYTEACIFADQVIERFKNPYLDHKWLSISFAFTSKMLTRNLPLIQAHFINDSGTPSAMALGFAAYLLFMKSKKSGDYFVRIINDKTCRLNDDKADVLASLWEEQGTTGIVQAVLVNKELWGEDLTIYTSLLNQVQYWLNLLIENGAKKTLSKFVTTEVK